MDINKITITPITKYCRAITIKQPSESQATLLMLDKLKCKNNAPKYRKKLPKELREFVNPKSWVGTADSTTKTTDIFA
jgi:hypothetical protein